jgi:hypothetical protein
MLIHFTDAAYASRSNIVPIRRFLEAGRGSFGPEEIASMSTAFEAELSKLELVDRSDPKAATVAKLIIELAKNGERDPKKLCDETLKIVRK